MIFQIPAEKLAIKTIFSKRSIVIGEIKKFPLSIRIYISDYTYLKDYKQINNYLMKKY